MKVELIGVTIDGADSSVGESSTVCSLRKLMDDLFLRNRFGRAERSSPTPSSKLLLLSIGTAVCGRGASSDVAEVAERISNEGGLLRIWSCCTSEGVGSSVEPNLKSLSNAAFCSSSSYLGLGE